MTENTPTSLYRYYDGKGILLYVGITSRGMSRNVEHSNVQPWWPYVAKQDVQHFKTRRDALIAEKSLIKRHRPPFNKQHNPDHGSLAAIYLQFRELEPKDMSPGVIMHRNKGRLGMEIVSFDGEFMVCRSLESDLSLSSRINLSLSKWNTFALPELGLIGHVTHWARAGFLVEITLRGKWLHRVDAVKAIVDKKKRGHFIRTVELSVDGEWKSAKPQRFSDPYGDEEGAA